MSNTITIKHGTDAPSNGTLQPFELGYVTSTGTLVIGDVNNNAKALNYLQLNTDGTLTLPKEAYLKDGRLILDSKNVGNPKIFFTNSTHSNYSNSKVSIGMLSSGNRCQIIHWGQNENGEEKYEIFRFPAPDSPMESNQTFQVLTTKGGTLVVSEGNYGTTDPNTAGTSGGALSGKIGQLYFVIAE